MGGWGGGRERGRGGEGEGEGGGGRGLSNTIQRCFFPTVHRLDPTRNTECTNT